MGREKGKQLTTTKPASNNEQTNKDMQELKAKLAKVCFLFNYFNIIFC